MSHKIRKRTAVADAAGVGATGVIACTIAADANLAGGRCGRCESRRAGKEGSDGWIGVGCCASDDRLVGVGVVVVVP